MSRPPPLTLGSFLTEPLPSSPPAPNSVATKPFFSSADTSSSINNHKRNAWADRNRRSPSGIHSGTTNVRRSGSKDDGSRSASGGGEDSGGGGGKRPTIGADNGDGTKKKKRRWDAGAVPERPQAEATTIPSPPGREVKRRRRERGHTSGNASGLSYLASSTSAQSLFVSSVVNVPPASITATASTCGDKEDVTSSALATVKSKVPIAPFSTKRVEREFDSRDIVLYRSFAPSCSVGLIMKCMRNLEAIVVCEFELKDPNMSTFARIEVLARKGVPSVVVGRLKNLNFVRNKVAHPTGFLELTPAECVQFFNEYVVLMEALEAFKGGRFTCFPYWKPVDKPMVEGAQGHLEKVNNALKRRIDKDKKTARRQAAALWAKNKTLEAEKEAAIGEAAVLKAQLEDARSQAGKKEEVKKDEKEGMIMDAVSNCTSASTSAPVPNPVPTVPSESIAMGTTVRIVKETSDHCNEVGPITKITRCYVWVRIPGKGEPRFRKTSVSVTPDTASDIVDKCV